MLAAGRIWPGVSRQLDNFLWPQGAFPPGYYPLRGGGVDHPAPEASLTRGMPKGPLAFLGNDGRVWATALLPDPPKKDLVPHFHVRWGVEQIPQLLIEAAFVDSVVGSHFERPCWLRRGSGRVRLGSWIFPTASGGLPPRLLPPSWGLGWSPGAWDGPNKGNADGAVGIFWKCRARVGYGLAPGPTKKGLVPYLPVIWGAQQIGIVLELWRLEIALDHLTCYRNNGSQYYCRTIYLFYIH